MLGYVKDFDFNLYVRKQGFDIKSPERQSSVSGLLETVRNIADRSVFSPEVRQLIVDWPTEYHFSVQRHCLLRPLGIKPGDRVLEIGAGCGALTRYLGELGAEIFSFERNRKHAEIAAARCVDLPNVRVYCGSAKSLQIDLGFDWVLLVGGLEYSPVFIQNDDPIGTALNLCRSYLNDGGKLVIGIENKFGMKYLTGCSEDHLGRSYYGVQGLYDLNEPRTWGRRELEDELRSSGFNDLCFWYPFPDYKIPSVMISDRALSCEAFDAGEMVARVTSRDYAGLQHRVFDERLALREVARNGLLGDLANSFLVIAARGDVTASCDPDVIAVSYAVQRRSNLSVETLFVQHDGEVTVSKRTVTPDPVLQVTSSSGIPVRLDLRDAPYIRGQLALWPIIQSRARSRGLNDIVKAFEPWFKHVLNQTNMAGETDIAAVTIDGALFDLTPFNLIETDTGFVAIDQEWVVGEKIPLGWVVTRAVWHCLNSPGLEKRPASLVAVLQALAATRQLSIAEADIKTWLNWEVEVGAAIYDTCPQPVPEVRSLASYSVALPFGLSPPIEHIAQIEAELRARSERLDEISERYNEMSGRFHEISERLDEIYASTSWRLTAPLRAVKRLMAG